MLPKEQDQWFNTAYWIAMNRPFFYKAVVFVILFGTAIMWGIGGLFWFNYLIDTQKYNRMMAGMFDQVIDYKGAHGRSVPKPLVISEETALISSGTKADAVAKISNPNAKWRIAELEYQFTVNGAAGPVEKTWILPNDERYIASFLIPANIDLKKIAEFGKENKLTAKLTIINIKWQRMRADPVKMPMFEFKIQPSAGNIFSASVANKTILSFWNVGVYMIRYGRGSELTGEKERIIGAKFLSLDQVTALKTRDFSVVWESNPQASRTVLEGETDPYDSNNLMPFDQGSATQTFN
ncbi:MAG: hypothetical protein AAB793_00480 [Patescibacteria group bacterium]